MSKRTLILILILVIVTAGLVTIALAPQKKYVAPPIPVRKPMTLSVPPQTSLTIAHNPTTVSTTSAAPLYELPISISTGTNKVTAVQLELSYDPNMLTNVDIKPGTFLKNPVVLLKQIDTQNGRISYALGISPGGSTARGSGTVAVVTFMSKGSTGQTTTISILPKSLATAQGTDKSVLKFSLGTTFTLGQSPSSSSIPPSQSSPATSSGY